MTCARWRRPSAVGAVVCLALALVGVSPAAGGGDERLDLELCAPDEQRFTLDIGNKYFPLPVRQQWIYSGEEEGQTLGLRITVFDETEDFYGGTVTTRVVEEVEWEDGSGDGVIDSDENLIEVSRNYFAQTKEGTVCYFGEDVDIYENGVIVSDEGSWRADADGNAPGIYMPKRPEKGMTYQQEVAPGVAEDEATVTKVGAKVRVPAGTFTDTVTVRDRNPLDGSTGTKAYAAGVGLIQDAAFELISY
jgi:hypothetical protein